MSSIFISYARKDQPVARWLAESLQRDGWQVWWDPEIVPGDQFNTIIRENLDSADYVIVIWSKASADSIWVRAEASEGLGRDCLIPISVGQVKPPLPFNQFQTVDFTGWRGDPAHPSYQTLVQALKLRQGQSEKEVISERPMPRVDSQRFSIVVARIQNDIGQQLQEIIASDLADFEAIHVLTLDRSVTVEGQDPEKSFLAAREKARDFLDEMSATVMIWGKILRFGGKEIPQLQLTVSRSKDQRHGRYVPTDELRLPQLFWSDLADILRLVILTYDADFREQEGFYLADQLQPFITRIQRLLQRADQAHGWSADARGLTRINLADALALLGNQRGDNAPLEQSIAIYREALTELSRERSPRDWSRGQNGLGISLWLLGSRTGDNQILTQAIAAYQLALEERRRDHDPLDWAQSYNDLGNVLATLGQHDSDNSHLEEAVQAYETALLERRLEAKPLDWAQTMNNLGVALWYLGQRESGVERLSQAVATLKASFKVYTREKTPLDWAQTQNNLGLALWTFGSSQSNAEFLKQSVIAFREALRERKQKLVPLLWAQTQNNLGLVLIALGQMTNNTRQLGQAIIAFTHALSERTQQRSPMEWAQTQNNLGAALWYRGRIQDQLEDIRAAVAAYRNALNVYSPQSSSQEWAQTQHNLANALAVLGDRQNNDAYLKEALARLSQALSNYDRQQEPLPWAQTQGDLGVVANLVGKNQHDMHLLQQAATAFEACCQVYQQSGMQERAAVFAEKLTSVNSLIKQFKSETVF